MKGRSIAIIILFIILCISIAGALVYWLVIRKKKSSTIPVTCTTKPANITALKSTTAGTEVTLSWTASTASNILAYQIAIGNNKDITNKTPGIVLKSAKANATTFTYVKPSVTIMYFAVYTLTTDGCVSVRSGSVPG